eukprot:3726276-Karenia_brevis.AAC.1
MRHTPRRHPARRPDLGEEGLTTRSLHDTGIHGAAHENLVRAGGTNRGLIQTTMMMMMMMMMMVMTMTIMMMMHDA